MKCNKQILASMLVLALPMSMTAQSFEVDMSKQTPNSYSVEVPDGNYKVTVVLGSKKKAAKTVVRAEARRLMVDEVATKKGEFKMVQFVVNKRSPKINGKMNVRVKPREKGTADWDDKLTIDFYGAAPAVKTLKIERDTTATTLFLW